MGRKIDLNIKNFDYVETLHYLTFYEQYIIIELEILFIFKYAASLRLVYITTKCTLQSRQFTYT